MSPMKTSVFSILFVAMALVCAPRAVVLATEATVVRSDSTVPMRTPCPLRTPLGRVCYTSRSARPDPGGDGGPEHRGALPQERVAQARPRQGTGAGASSPGVQGRGEAHLRLCRARATCRPAANLWSRSHCLPIGC